jgi:hypothetical protein
MLMVAAAAVLTALGLLVGSSPAFAAKSAQAGGGGKSGGGGGSLSLVMVNDVNGNGLPNYGDSVTFNVSTTATSQPNVDVRCYQNGVLVYGATAGFYPSYPWPWDQTFMLSSPSWTGGAASCAAVLSYSSGAKTVTLATLAFPVYA